MDNEELKKKIVEILDNNIRWQPYYYISRGIVYEDDLKNIADALIAAGIGDISRWQLMSKVLHNQIMENSREEKHRTEVAERQAIFLSKMLADKTRKDYPWQAWYDYGQQQAEKEITGEKKEE